MIFSFRRPFNASLVLFCPPVCVVCSHRHQVAVACTFTVFHTTSIDALKKSGLARSGAGAAADAARQRRSICSQINQGAPVSLRNGEPASAHTVTGCWSCRRVISVWHIFVRIFQKEIRVLKLISDRFKSVFIHRVE